ncbi:MAG TPA: mechanosensitive ion channel family protein [Steroidobacteraceae bacterium]|nr:mechanosensitive ion channel family protein [Steroidobacteraceae bacterium]
MPDFNSVESASLFGNSLLSWLIALGVILVLFFVLLTARSAVRRYHARLRQTNSTELTEIPVEILSRTTLLFFVVVSIFAGLSTLAMPDRAQRVLEAGLMLTLFFQVGVWVSAAAMAWLERRRRRTATLSDRAVAGSLGIIAFILRVAIWSLVLLVALDNLGIDVTALVAGLGIGGIAVALAAQNVLGDLFASLSIAFDKPFLVGDFLILDDYLGSVEDIGVKSTRLRSLSGEQIILSNADLLKSRVRNYGRMFERRIVMNHTIAYGTPLEQLREIPEIIRAAIQAQSDTRFDRAHFARHGSDALEFESVYFVLSPDYNRYMDIQQEINLRIHQELEGRGIEFAFPTRFLYLARAPRKERGKQSGRQDGDTAIATP